MENLRHSVACRMTFNGIHSSIFI